MAEPEGCPAQDFRKRKLELEAFSSLIDALRAAGPLTSERRTLLEQTATSLKITPDRYKAEIRRALSKPNPNGDQDEVTWALEGRRNTFLLPRAPPRSTIAAPYSAYTPRMRPALLKLPVNPRRSIETQTIAPTPVVNPKLLVVGSPRPQTTHTMVYAKPTQHRQVRISPQGQPMPIVVNAKSQSKIVTVNSAPKPAGTVTTVNAQKLTPQGQLVNPPTQLNRQIVLAAPGNIVQRLGTRTLPAAQIRPTIGSPVVTKVLNPNRTGELKIIQKPRVAQIRTAGTSVQLTPIGVRFGPVNGKHLRVDQGEGEMPPTKLIKSGTQWNYDDHSVMAKPAAIDPQGKPEETFTVKEIKGRSLAAPAAKAVQVVQMSTNAQIVVPVQRVPKQVRTVPQTAICAKARELVRTKNVVVQNLPYPNFQGTFVKMVPEKMTEEEVV